LPAGLWGRSRREQQIVPSGQILVTTVFGVAIFLVAVL
jgi:hypothetical protein